MLSSKKWEHSNVETYEIFNIHIEFRLFFSAKLSNPYVLDTFFYCVIGVDIKYIYIYIDAVQSKLL